MKNIGVIGGGLIGASWAAIFSKSGFNVFVYDPYPDVFETYKSRVSSFLEELKAIDGTINIEESLNRIKANVSLEDLCSNVEYIQESPGENTSNKTIEKTKEIFSASGASIVNVKKEIDGFILNRLQGALLNEAMRLYSDGYASADEIDATVRDGLGLRWAFMGPFETIDLNAPGGIKDYISRYGPIFVEMAKNQIKIPDWSEEAGKKLELERRKILSHDELEGRAKKRNQLLKLLRKVKIDNGEA